jgi:hypothetical protein
VPSFGGEVKQSVQGRRFAACRRSLQIAWNSLSDVKIHRTFLAHISLLLEVSSVVVGVGLLAV